MGFGLENFLDNWDIWHAESHWSNKKSKERFVRNVMLPYVQRVRRRRGLPEGHDHALVMFDHHTSNVHNPALYEIFQQNRILWQLVPKNATDHCQVMCIESNS